MLCSFSRHRPERKTKKSYFSDIETYDDDDELQDLMELLNFKKQSTDYPLNKTF